MVQLAKDYRISDVGLRKICKRLDVPTPPQGYWARKYRKGPPKLQPTQGPTYHDLVIDFSEPEPPPKPEYLDPRSAKLIAYEHKQQSKVKVKKHLRNPHRLVTMTKRQLADADPDRYNRLCSWWKDGMGISVCKESVNRTLLILDAVTKALEKRGYSVKSTEGKGEVTILDEKISFAISEKVIRYEPKISPEEKAKNPYKYYDRYAYKSTGTLELSIWLGSYSAWRSWKDSRKRTVEDCLQDFMIGLIEAAEAVKRSRLEKQLREERWRIERENEYARQCQAEQEKTQREELDHFVASWHKARRIREFLTAIENERQPIELSSALAGWIIWASNYADSLDPIS
ncbi:MAG: hypothetical protein ACSLFH_08995 [Desulfuromonadales bacterium]